MKDVRRVELAPDGAYVLTSEVGSGEGRRVDRSTLSSLGGVFSAVAGVSGRLTLADPVALTENATAPAAGELDIAPGVVVDLAGHTLTVPKFRDPGARQVFTGAGSVVFQNVDRIRPEWWGATFDGATDDAPALQAALDAAVASGKRCDVVLPTARCRIESALTIDIGHANLSSPGAVIDASPITAGHAILLQGSPTASVDLYQQNRAALTGIDLVGNDRAGTVVGILNETTGASSNRTAHNVIRRGRVRTFGVGISFEDYAYLITAYDLNIHDCGVCVDSPNGTADSGERITFINCNFFNSDQGLRLANVNADFHLIGCSLDYISGRYVNLTGGSCFLANCHIEGNYDADYWLYVSGNGRLLKVQDSHFVVNNATKTAFEIGYSDSSVGFGGLVLRDIYTTWANNYQLRHFAAGTGRVVMQGWTHPTNNRMPQAAPFANRLWDSSFETGTAEWDLTGGTDNATRDNARANSGAWSVYFSPTVDGNSVKARAEFRAAPGESVRVSYYAYSTGIDATSTWHTTLKWLDRSGTVIGQQEASYSNDFGGGSVWSHLRNILEANAPAGTESVAVQLELRTAATTAKVWVDDVDVSII